MVKIKLDELKKYYLLKKQKTVINAFYPLINRIEHIDSILENNLSIEELKLVRTYSIVLTLERLMEEKNYQSF